VLKGLPRQLFIRKGWRLLKGVQLLQQFPRWFFAVDKDVVEGLPRRVWCQFMRRWRRNGSCAVRRSTRRLTFEERSEVAIFRGVRVGHAELNMV
jgi:hypothetical protein